MTTEARSSPPPLRLPNGGAVTGAYVDGAPRETAGETLVVEDPANAATICTFAEAQPDVVVDAVRSAHEAFQSWRDTKGLERSRMLARLSAAIIDASEELAFLESTDTGKPLRQARSDVLTAARYCEFYGSMADKLYGETIPGDGDYWAYTLREPYGVIAHITPWNSPLSQMMRGVAPSLAAGNTVVVKPSEVTPLSTLLVAELFTDAGLPPGVVNVVAGRGTTTGASLVEHAQIAHVTFTGSVATGRRILHVAAERIIACNLELGGKSPTIVFPDADLDSAVTAGAMAVVRNAGQSCFATTRLLVHRSILDEYVERLRPAFQALTIGAGVDDQDLGPLASRAQLDRVVAAIDRARDQGADLAVGGERPADLPGYFLTPAVLTQVDNTMDVAQHEVFGPVQTVIPFETEAEAVALANDSAYGLAAGIFTSDVSRAHRVARRLEAGQVQVNGYPLGGVETPFGGYKESGLGREKGLAAFDHYTQLKTVIVKR